MLFIVLNTVHCALTAVRFSRTHVCVGEDQFAVNSVLQLTFLVSKMQAGAVLKAQPSARKSPTDTHLFLIHQLTHNEIHIFAGCIIDTTTHIITRVDICIA